jgi:alkanesulfonate monooxygenase SsuD/methylene tetrahydromethanopterin reductase-like flavin-dependent oxidoreductase (luciferase family)
MSARARKYGLLLPHFGEFASRKNLIEGAQKAERYGFDTAWRVRTAPTPTRW